jgi:hypothetical protein
MEQQLVETGAVTANFFGAMESTITAYGPRAIKVSQSVGGTAFFPEGIGLWLTSEPRGMAPVLFPRSPLEIVDHRGAFREEGKSPQTSILSDAGTSTSR